MMKSFDRATNELIKLTVTDDRVPVITGVSYAIVPTGQRPTVWTPVESSGSKIYARISNIAPGNYHVWVQVITSDETAVIDVDAIKIT